MSYIDHKAYLQHFISRKDHFQLQASPKLLSTKNFIGTTNITDEIFVVHNASCQAEFFTGLAQILTNRSKQVQSILTYMIA